MSLHCWFGLRCSRHFTTSKLDSPLSNRKQLLTEIQMVEEVRDDGFEYIGGYAHTSLGDSTAFS